MLWEIQLRCKGLCYLRGKSQCVAGHTSKKWVKEEIEDTK